MQIQSTMQTEKKNPPTTASIIVSANGPGIQMAVADQTDHQRSIFRLSKILA